MFKGQLPENLDVTMRLEAVGVGGGYGFELSYGIKLNISHADVFIHWAFKVKR